MDVGCSSYCGKEISDNDKKIDGLEEILMQIDSKRSKILWKMLTEKWDIYKDSMQVLRNHYGSRGGDKGRKDYDTSISENLHTREWILNKAGELVSADAVTIQTLSDEYDKDSVGAQALIRRVAGSLL